jgi:hypothetical protein
MKGLIRRSTGVCQAFYYQKMMLAEHGSRVRIRLEGSFSLANRIGKDKLG